MLELTLIESYGLITLSASMIQSLRASLLSPFYFSIYIGERMLKKVLGALWRHAPKSVRRWGVRLVEPRFTVTAGAVVVDERGRVLLLNHVFRVGSGWGIPGGFMEKGEQPEEALAARATRRDRP